MRVVLFGDPRALGADPALGFDLTPAIRALENAGVDCHQVGEDARTVQGFRACLDELRPDVVHVHGCPPGAQLLLAAARQHGAAVVLSMPDYSWICERGTCIDASGTPCLPAVAPGSCACLSGSDSLAGRNRVLREALRPADVALIPPLLSRERLVASGIEAEIRHLDPTGVQGPDHLRAAYRDAVQRRRESPPGAPRKPNHVVFVVGAGGSPLRYRVHQKVEQLAIRGISSELRWYAEPRLPAAMEGAGAVIVYRAPATRQFVDAIRGAREAGIPTFWDVDDLIFDPQTVDELPIHGRRPREERDAWIESAHRYQAMLVECGAGIASTPEIARHMGRMGIPAEVLPNGVDTMYSAIFEGVRRTAGGRRARGAPFTIGYCSGSDTHDEDFELVGPTLATFLQSHPGVRMLLVGPLVVPAALAPFSRRITKVGWVPGTEVPKYLARFDLNIAPLVDHSFTNGKSAIKWSEAALVGVPTLAWATEPFRAAIDDGRTGFLAADTAQFAERLEYALETREKLRDVADAARLAAFEKGSPWVLGAQLTRILATRERAPVQSQENRWPCETHLTEVEPAGLVQGLSPRMGRDRPGERLDGAVVGFTYPLHKGPLRRADVQIASWLQPVHSPLELRIQVGARTLASVEVPPCKMVDNGWVAFNFDPPVLSVRGARAELHSDRDQNIAPYVMRSGSRFVNGIRRRGAVVARTFHEPPVPPDFSPPPPAASPGLALARVEDWCSLRLRSLRRTAVRGIRKLVVRRPSAVREASGPADPDPKRAAGGRSVD